MINKFKIYGFVRKNKYRLVAGIISGVALVTIGCVTISSTSNDIKYNNYGVTRKTVQVVRKKENTTSKTTKPTIINNYKNDNDYDDYYYNYYEDYEFETTVNFEATNSEKVVETTFILESENTTNSTFQDTSIEDNVDVESITTEPIETNTESNTNSDYYIDPEGNYWNSYEEYKEYYDALNTYKVYTYR